MIRKQLALVCAVLGTIYSSSLARAEAPRPNIIFIMADDLGNADLGYRGGKVETPNIDKLAKKGFGSKSFYGQQVCTPSRAALMTGRYPMRYGLQTLVIFPSHTYGLPTDERTLPQALKDAGYNTLMVGKWHLGHADKKYWPQNRGFDYFYGNVVGEVDYFTRERGGLIDWQRNGEFLTEKGYYTNLIGDDAIKLIDRQDDKRPFFLYFASLAPHAPFQAHPASSHGVICHRHKRRIDGICKNVVDSGVAGLDPADLCALMHLQRECGPSERNHSQTRRAEPVSAKRAKTLWIAVTTASSGWKRISPSASPQTKPAGNPRRSSPRAALLRMPPLRRARSTCSSASLMVPLSPSRSRSLKRAG